MRRRPGAGPERAKSRRRKTVTQKRRGLTPFAAHHKRQSDVAQLTRERDEALEREKATAEVAARNFKLAGRSGAGVPGDTAECHANLRGQVRHVVSLQR